MKATCPRCGSVFTAAQFDRFPLKGYAGARLDGRTWEAFEVRTCGACGGPLAVLVPMPVVQFNSDDDGESNDE